jgi:hypothetical protein
MSAISGLIKVTKKGATAPAKVPPFYSAVDEVAQGLSRNKGTGKEFLREIEKTKGVKPAEIKDRKLDKILNTDQKMTKDDLVKVLEDNPPKQITEETPGGISKSMIDDKIYEMIEAETKAELGPRPKLGYEREDWLEDFDRLIEEKSYRKDDYYQEAKEALMEEGNIGEAAYDRPDLKLPGGENYREILLKLPTFDPNKEKQLMELEANLRRMNPVNFPPGYLDSMKDEVVKLKAEKASFGKEYKSSHWDQPNVLAHMRVQDRVGPNGEKVLHVEEIQSDWHQEGRKKGYRKPGQPERLKGEPYQLDDGTYGVRWEDGSVSDLGWGKDHAERLAAQGKLTGDVPDAPFKKNWHELAMKRLINYASENGYDKIAITPGAEQANRYKMSSFINNMIIGGEHAGLRQITWMPKDGRAEQALKFDKEGNVKQAMISELQGKNISDIFGKDLAEEIIQSKPYRRIEGVDLNVGGEGMKGFYDQMLPAYLNKYGEKYGAKVGQIPISRGEKMVPDNAGLGMIRSGEPDLTQLHSFDITPQMREEVLTKGQPLYQQIGIPAATGAAGAGMLEDEPAFNRSEKVNITDNPDTMFLELNDQHYGVGGAAKKAIKAIKGTQNVLPAAERDANLQKLLSESKTPMRLYHGTTATEGGKGAEAIRRIKPSKEGALGSGVYLTPKTAHASGYTGIPNDEAISLMQSSPYYKDIADQFMADRASGTLREGQTGGNMLPVHAQIRNPLIIGQSDRGIDPAAEALVMLGMDESKAISLVEKAYEEKGNIGKQIQSRAQAQGYDGLMQYRNGELSEVVSYNPSSVKSAIGNKGTYDTTQPDINEAQGGLATLKRK